MRFSRSKSIAHVIRKRYCDIALKNVRKFERLDCHVKKCQMDIEFLNTGHRYNVILNFLRFRVTNKTLKDSLTYSRCQQLLLNEEIRRKKRRLPQLVFEYNGIRRELQYQLSPIYFMHVSSLTLAHLHLKVCSTPIAAFRSSLAILPHFVWISKKNFSFFIFQCFS